MAATASTVVVAGSTAVEATAAAIAN